MRNVIVTGGTRGIGKAISMLFHKNGDRVFAIYNKDEKSAKALENEVGIITIKADVSKASEVEKIINYVHSYGRCDVLINNAGIAQIKPFNDISEEDWDRMFSVNVKSAYLMSKAILSDMLVDKRGQIVNISSIWGQTGASCEVHYSASKAALIGFTKALAKELGPSGITVNCIAPGVINTDMNKELTPEIIEELKEEIPLSCIGQPEDIAKTAYFLSTDGGKYITGQVIGINGGMEI